MDTVSEEIKNLRTDIDKLDQKILRILKERINVTQRIGKIKRTHHSDILDKQRESEILSSLLVAGREYGIDDSFISTLWRQIIDYSYKVQEESE
jgi:chorismate mutase